MNKLVLFSALALAAPAPLGAQQMVVKKAALSPGQEQAQRAVMLLRDSVLGAQAALAELERDFQAAAPSQLEARARRITTRCAGAARTLPTARHLLVSADLTAPEHQRGRDYMLGVMDRTKRALADCERTFAPLGEQGKGEEVRGYGNRRAAPIRKGLAEYESSLHGFAQALGLDTRTLLKAGEAPIK